MSRSDLRTKVKATLQKKRNPQEVSCKLGRRKVPTPRPESPLHSFGSATKGDFVNKAKRINEWINIISCQYKLKIIILIYRTVDTAACKEMKDSTKNP
jgi:hypothetical protein